MSITILKAGFQDLIQDLGRNGYTHMGISPTGAADNISFRIGERTHNLLDINKEKYFSVTLNLENVEKWFIKGGY